MEKPINNNYAFIDSQKMIPNKQQYSSLFRKMMPHIVFMDNLKNKLEYKKK